jgi:hypothetical protein
MGDQCLTSESFVLVKVIDSPGEKGADLLGIPRHRLIRGENCSESASLMGVPGREMPFISLGGISSLVEESTLSSAEPGLFREKLCKAALKRGMCEHATLGKLIADRRPPGLPVRGVLFSRGISL